MISKTLLVLLTIGAFLYALWLVVFRRDLPDPKRWRGFRRRFVLATLLFVGLFGTMSVKGSKPKPDVMCYKMMAPVVNANQLTTREQLAGTLKAVWRTLDPNRAEEFRSRLEGAAGQSVIRKKTADMLAIAFSEVAYHKKRTRGDGPKMTCYDMGMLDGMLITTRENALKQLELLQKARKSGKIDEETCKKALAVLSREVEMLYQAKSAVAKDHIAQRKLIGEYHAEKLIAGDSASVAAWIIVAMEEGKVADMTPAKRLSVMKERVEGLLTGGKGFDEGGPAGNDWMDPAINPNVYAVLEKAGIMSVRSMVMCYDRMASPVTARSEELKKLQQELLDKNVKAGVLDVEVAEKAAAATDKTEIDYATEADIRDYQKKVRRIMRMLYKHGEVPSSFVEKIERAADIEIISFAPGKALRNDVRWYLQSLFWAPIGDDFMKALEKRKLIGPARNHRRVMDWSGHNHPTLLDSKKKQMADFEGLLDSKDELVLDGDEKVTIKKYQVPGDNRKYRLGIRRVCRVLVKAGLINQDQLGQLEPVEDLIGVPILGVIEK